MGTSIGPSSEYGGSGATLVDQAIAAEERRERMVPFAREPDRIEEKREGLDVMSPGSPLGAALLGAKAGDTISFEAPNGARLEVEIVAIET